MRAWGLGWLHTPKQIGRIRRMTEWAKFRDISETKHRASAWKWKEGGNGGGGSAGDRGWSLAQGRHDRTKEEWRYAGVEEDPSDGEDMIDVLGEDEDAPLLTTFATRARPRGD